MAERNATDPKPMLEGALLAAVAVVTMMGTYYLPLVGPFVMLALPAPYALAYYRRGLRIGIMTLVVAVLVSGFFIGFLSALSMGLGMGLTGLAFGYGFSHEIDPQHTLLVGLAAMAIALVLAGLLSTYVLGINPIEMHRNVTRQALEQAENLAQRFNLDSSEKQVMDELREAFELLMGSLLPGMVAIGLILLTLATYSLTAAIMKHLGAEIRDLPAFSRWQLPSYAVWFYVLGFALLYAATRMDFGVYEPAKQWMSPVGHNLVLFFSLVFLVQGFSVIYFFLERYDVPSWFRWVVLAMVYFVPILAQLSIWAGMLESVMHYRKGILASEEER